MDGVILQADAVEGFSKLLSTMVVLMLSVTILVFIMRVASDGPPKPDARGRLATLSSAASGHRIGALVGLAALIGIAWFMRPWLHGLAYFIWATPLLWFVGGVGLLLLIALNVSLEPAAAALVGNVVLGVTVVILIIGLVFAGWYASEDLSDQTMERATVSDELMETNAEQPRVVPRAVANRFASNTLDLPTYRVAESDITMYNGTPYWSYPLAPDGFRNYLIEDQDGTVLVDMTDQNIRVQTERGRLQEGIGTAVWNRYKWHLLKNGQYLVDYKDPFMVIHEGDQYIAVPYVKPQFHLWYTTPEWGGVALIHEDGTVEDLSPAQARQHPALEGQRLYPFDLAYKEVRKTKFRNGIVNQLPAIGAHREEIEIAAVPGSGNSQPFFVLDDDAYPHYFIAVEPYGDAQGLREVWTLDARTGEYERYNPDESLTGPRKATDYVRQAARTTDWDRFVPSEPIPTIIDGKMYWSVRVVPDDASGISYVAFVDAETADVAEAETSAEISAFIAGDTEAIDTTEPPSDDGREPTIIVQRIAENGTVIETLEIYGNESVVVKDGE